MKLYLAAPWIERHLMEMRASQFEAEGHTITWKWWKTDDIPEGIDHEDKLQEQAWNDWNGVKKADYLVLFNTSKSEGKAVEQGLALAYEIPIIAIGERGSVSKNVFHYLHRYRWVKSLEEALACLRT